MAKLYRRSTVFELIQTLSPGQPLTFGGLRRFCPKRAQDSRTKSVLTFPPIANPAPTASSTGDLIRLRYAHSEKNTRLVSISRKTPFTFQSRSTSRVA